MGRQAWLGVIEGSRATNGKGHRYSCYWEEVHPSLEPERCQYPEGAWMLG